MSMPPMPVEIMGHKSTTQPYVTAPNERIPCIVAFGASDVNNAHPDRPCAGKVSVRASVLSRFDASCQVVYVVVLLLSLLELLSLMLSPVMVAYQADASKHYIAHPVSQDCPQEHSYEDKKGQAKSATEVEVRRTASLVSLPLQDASQTLWRSAAC